MKITGVSLALIMAVLSFATSQVKSPPQAMASSRPRKQAFRIRITTPHTIVKAGSEVLVEITVTNNSRDQLTTGSPRWEPTGFDIRDSQGNESLTKRGRCLVKGECEPVTIHCPETGSPCEIVNLPMYGGPTRFLKSGESFSEATAIPLDSYDLSRPGKYTVRWQCNDPTGKTVVKSNKITLTVIP
jgi:hypothetical protein